MNKKAKKQKTFVSAPLLGVGGSVKLTTPVSQTIVSFREWDHYHNPVGEYPHHRFWTWAKMDRPVGTPAGKCLEGSYSSREDMEKIFICDKEIIVSKIDAGYIGNWHGIGNEPNWRPEIAPVDYAYQYNKYYVYIKSLDPAAKIMTGGVTLPVPWLDWVKQVLASYQAQFGVQMPVDIWSIHPYSFDWASGKLAAQDGIKEVKQFRAFIDKRGYINAPIVIGEFSDGGGGQPIKELIKYAKVFCSWLVNNYATHRIIAWYWWGASTNGMGNAGLFDKGTLTSLGETYINCCGKKIQKVYLPIVMK